MVGQLHIPEPPLPENLPNFELFREGVGWPHFAQDSGSFGLFLVGDVFVGRGEDAMIIFFVWVFGGDVLDELVVVGEEVFVGLGVFGGFEMGFGGLEEDGFVVGGRLEGLDLGYLLFLLEEMFVKIKFLHTPIVLHLIDIVNKYI